MSLPRILHVLDHSLPLHSGYTFRTAAILRQQRALGWETLHLTSPKQGDSARGFEDADGLRFYRSPAVAKTLDRLPLIRELALMRALEKRLLAVARELKPDLIHAHSPVLNVLPAIRVGRALGIPVVYEIRAFWEDAAVDHGTTQEGSLRYKLTRGLETFALRRVDQITTICEGLRADIVARGIAADKVTIIPNAVDVSAFARGGTPDEALKASLGLAGKTVLGFIGSFYAYEGLDLLLDAMPRMLAARSDIALLLLGGGPQEAALRAQAERLGIAHAIVMPGRVPHSQVQAYYDLIDVLAYPRHPMRLTELVTPLKPLEAMAQERIFVASDVGGHKELIRHNETGVLFTAGDVDALAQAMLDLLAQPERWPALRAQGRHFVEHERNWKNSVARYVQVYSAALGRQVAVA